MGFIHNGRDTNMNRISIRRNRSGCLALILWWSVAVTFAAEPASVSGVTEAINDVTMSSPVIGIIGARLFEEGAFVKKGQVIVELDKRIEELEVSRRKLVRELAKTELNRVKSLSARSAISISQEEIDKKDADFQVASVDHQLSEENLRRRLLVAPFDGSIIEFYLKVGEGCEARQPVLRIVDTRHCYFVANVETRTGFIIREGQQVRLEIESGPSTATFPGTIKYVAPVVDAASGLMKVKAVFENPSGRIRPGVAGRMVLKEEPNAR